MLDQKLVEETINDIQECKAKILQRHEGDTTFTLRVDSVFNSLINSLAGTTGKYVNETVKSGFVPKPLESVAGQKINSNAGVKLELPTLEVDQAKAFKEEIQLIHDGFLNRENIELLDALKEVQFRGVAKIAGVENYESQPINGEFVQKIKDKISANIQDAENRAKSKNDLNKTNTADKNKTPNKADTVKSGSTSNSKASE